ncbi:hypothetical protein D3C86_1938900 [compost metagenome]
MTVQAGAHIIRFAAEFDPGNVADAHDGPATVAFNDDIAKLLRGLQARLRAHGGRQLLIVR